MRPFYNPAAPGVIGRPPMTSCGNPLKHRRRGHRHFVIVTGVPAPMRSTSRRIVSIPRRMQPCETALPRVPPQPRKRNGLPDARLLSSITSYSHDSRCAADCERGDESGIRVPAIGPASGPPTARGGTGRTAARKARARHPARDRHATPAAFSATCGAFNGFASSYRPSSNRFWGQIQSRRDVLHAVPPPPTAVGSADTGCQKRRAQSAT